MSRLSELKRYHETLFGRPQYYVHAPGRINLIGEHTDYNHGLVLPAAIDRGISFFFNFDASGDTFELFSKNLNDHRSFHREDPPLAPENWAKYPQALLRLIEKQYQIQVPAFRVSLHSNIPSGGGLSSSAALSVGFLTAINHHLSLNRPIRELAQLAQYTEHSIGANVGIMDPYAILAGRKNHFVFLDCKTNTHTLIPTRFDGHVLLLIDTGISHDLADSEYNDRRASCEKILNLARSFRSADYVSDLTFEDLQEIKVRFPQVSTTEVEYVLEENKRVLNMVKAMQSGDWEEAGRRMYAGHEGLSKKYRVSIPQLDYLAEQALESGMVKGARMMGGGFGGSTINLLEEKHLEEFQSRVNTLYFDKFGTHPRFLPVHPADGASIITAPDLVPD